MNKKLKQSSTNSEASRTGKHSIFGSSVTPFFVSMKDDPFETQKTRKNQDEYQEKSPTNTQQCVRRLVQKNQQSGFYNLNDGNIEDGDQLNFGFSFVKDFQSGENSHFSFNDNEFDHHFNFVSNFQSQKYEHNPQFFKQIQNGNYFGGSIAESQEYRQNQKKQKRYLFDENLNKNEKSKFYEMFSFQNEDMMTQKFNNQGLMIMNQQSKKLSFVDEIEEEKKDNIIYEVDSKFECEGQTSFIENSHNSKIQSQHTKSIQQKQSSDKNENRPSDYEKLRQSIIKQISQMDSDEWFQQNDNFDDTNESFNMMMSNKKMPGSTKMNESKSQEKKNTFKESIINKLFIQSDIQNDNVSRNDNILLRTSKSMIPFRGRNNQQFSSKDSIKAEKYFPVVNKKRGNKNLNHYYNDKQKNNEKMYESQVEQITNERIQILKNTDNRSVIVRKKQNMTHQKQKLQEYSSGLEDNKNINKKDEKNKIIVRNTNLFGRKNSKENQNQQKIKQQDNSTKQQHQETFQSQKRLENKQNQIIQRKRLVFQLKPRNYRINYQNQVIDEREEFEQPQQKKIALIQNNESVNENVQFKSDIKESKTIKLQNSETKKHKQIKSINNKSVTLETKSDDSNQMSKKSFKKLNIIDRKEGINLINQKQNKKIQTEHQIKIKSLDKLQNNEEISSIQKEKMQSNIVNLTINRKVSKEKKKKENQEKNLNVLNQNYNQKEKSIASQNSHFQKLNRKKRFELNFNRRNNILKQTDQQAELQKSQRISVASTHSLSSDGIKIDTKGFMDKVMNNNESLKNQRNQFKTVINIDGDDREKPTLNFKRLNRFSTMFGKDAIKQKPLKQSNQRQRQKQKQQKLIKSNQKQKRLLENPKQQILALSRSPIFQKHQKKITNNLHQQIQSSIINNQCQQKKQEVSQKDQVSSKSQQYSQLSVNLQRQSISSSFLPKYIFSKRTPPKQSIKSPVQSKSKSVTFDTVKRVENCNNGVINDDIDDTFSYDSEFLQQKPSINQNNKQTLVKRRENNLMTGISTNNKNYRQFKNQQNGQQHRQFPSNSSSSFPSISSRSRKSTQMMKQIVDVIQEAHNLQQKLVRIKRQREEQYQRVSFLNRLAKEKFSDQRIRQMMDWGEMEEGYRDQEYERDNETDKIMKRQQLSNE